MMMKSKRLMMRLLKRNNHRTRNTMMVLGAVGVAAAMASTAAFMVKKGKKMHLPKMMKHGNKNNTDSNETGINTDNNIERTE